MTGVEIAMHPVKLDDAKARLPDLVSAAANGETVYIVSGDQQVVQLVPVKPETPQPRFGSAAGMFTVRDDFDAPLSDFDEYLQ